MTIEDKPATEATPASAATPPAASSATSATPTNAATAPAAPAVAAAPPVASATPPPGSDPNALAGSDPSTTVMMPQAAFARLKREERRRGEKVLLDSLGVKTKEEAKALLDKVRAAPSATPTPASATPATPGTVPTAPVTPEALTDTGRLEQRLRHIERQNKLLKASTSASEAGFKLQVEAVRCGIVDPEYALVLARRHLQGKDEAALRAFNPKAFFEGLKNTNPALFQAPLTVPAGQATAGVPVAVESLSNGKPAAAQAPTPGVPNGKSKDVRSMSREELSDYYRKLGLKDPTIGS